MAVNKTKIQIGSTIYYAVDDRPYEGTSIEKMLVTSIEDNHFYAESESCPGMEMWLSFDENEYSTTGVFKTEKEAQQWLSNRA